MWANVDSGRISAPAPTGIGIVNDAVMTKTSHRKCKRRGFKNKGGGGRGVRRGEGKKLEITVDRVLRTRGKTDE